MREIRRSWARAAVGAALVAATAVMAGGGAGAQTSGATSDWPQPGGDFANSRAAVGSTIESSNVSGLTKAWEVTTPGSLTTAVVVVGDTIYMEDSRCIVTAIDRATGAVKWQSASVGFTIGPQGVSVGDGAVFATSPTGAIALEQDNGQVRWKKELTDTPTEGVDAQPQFVNGKVLIATVPVSARVQYQGGDRGVLYALDAKTGDIDWSFDTVASDDLWGNADLNSGGGAWYPPAVDPKAGLVYWGVANPAPFPGTAEFPNGSSRPGRNLYTDSTVASEPEDREAALVPPSGAARHLRPGLRARLDREGGDRRRGATGRDRRGQGRPGARHGPGDRQAPLEDGGRGAREPRPHVVDRTDRGDAGDVRRRAHATGHGRRHRLRGHAQRAGHARTRQDRVLRRFDRYAGR